ncbi:sn-glycerol-1-phosphate dehydrogenase [Methanococcus voltae]|uniref:Glycerol-1-phosphate dehydrogenase [NAD(P)+] n=2 Tax=Methanococcus voltae TaxID=2188 RepID=A0A8J7URI0_METVO|nr:sn-glycerol-1-phosphate dehydrogenase [Methanococcus voltae]MBP2172767.1 glycerol-1-phosphate dehydrogenase [NAD(P)+] [Methanococcus voltae]MBP2201823.1 glycerol-1-phosphate dehydrogenase [NAD(P)+] [Methanococcus voltae]MCS3922647.1 glycerol-1-phosphate dehydrogenase [NAD(P)+] [Methanococcus voltae PS]
MITIPRYTLVENGAINKIPELLEKLNLKNPLVITGKSTQKYNKLGYDYIYYQEVEYERFGKLNDENRKYIKESFGDYDCILGIGGGKSIDVAKYASSITKKPFISVPTTASNDGIASPIVSLSVPSFMAEPPIAVVGDIDIIKKSPKKLLASGAGDIVSNITAVLDWKLAHIENNEKYSESSAIFSKTIAEELIEYINNSKNKDNLKEYPKKIVKALIASGMAIAIAHSSRPASGSEHLFSHSLDKLKKEGNIDNKSLHGEQCGIGTLIFSKAYVEEGRLDNKEYHEILKSLKIVKSPVNIFELGYDEDVAIEALCNAHKLRKRYTILRNGFDKKKAIDILEKSQII